MTPLLRLSADDTLASRSLEDQAADTHAVRSALLRADGLLDRGRPASVVDLCRTTLRDHALCVRSAANMVLMLRKAGVATLADAVEAALTDALQSRPQTVQLRINRGRLLFALDRFDAARALLMAAVAEDPLNLPAINTLTTLHLRDANPEAAVAIWQPPFSAFPDQGALWLNLARLLAYGGHRDHARQVLDEAEPRCHDNRHAFENLADAIRGTQSATSQAAMTVELFDGFAPSYDKVLKNIENRGPDIITQLLGELDLPKLRKLAVLDAGCGTGLCAPGLRPYAKLLHGVDLSVAMLKLARKRKLYDLLTRTDLASIGTLPPGPFDLIVSSDVLVYFGDLAPVLANFARILRPGGWLLLTVESQPDTARGWSLATSGRHKHAAAYLRRALQAAGFAGPKILTETTLRMEMNAPIAGLGIAAQRLALFG